MQLDALPVQLKMLDPGIEPPSYAHPGDAGADLRTRVDLGIALGSGAGPDGSFRCAAARLCGPDPSCWLGLATKHELTIVNVPGTVDAGYRGEIAVTLLNTDRKKSLTLSRGDRIAQMVIQRVEYARFVPVADLPDSVRGTGGFGSTGGFAAQALAPEHPGAGK